jgi:uncharacterized protein involved in outer membrane biogenesis
LGDAPRFDGHVEGGADNLRSLLTWLKLDAGGVPADRLRRVTVTSGLSIAPDGIELANLDLRFDASRLTGSVIATPDARPALGANLRLDRINLEAYLPRAGATAPPATPSAPPLDWLSRIDANVKLQVDALTYNTLPVQGLLLDATLDNGTLSLHELSTENAAGLHATIGGTIKRARWPAELALTLTAQADDPSRLLELLGYDLATSALGPLTVAASASGPLDHLQVAIDGGLAGSEFHLLTDAADLLARRGTVALSLRHDEATAFLRALLPGYRPAADTLGPLSLTGTATLDGARVDLPDGALALGATRLDLRVGADLSDPRLGLALRVAAPSLALDPLLPRRLGERPPAPLGADLWALLAGLADTLAGLGSLDATMALELGALDYAHTDARAVALDLAVHDRALTAAHLKAEAWGGHVELSSTFDGAHEPALTVRATLAGVQATAAETTLLGAAPLDGRLDVEASVGASGTSARALLGSLAGGGRLGLRDGVLDGIDLAALAGRLRGGTPAAELARAVTQDLSGGRTALSSLDGGFTVRGASVTADDAKLVAAGGTIALHGSADLAARTIDLGLAVQLAGQPAPPAATVTLTGALEAPTRALDDQALLAFLAQRGARPGSGTRPAGSGGR